MFITSSISIVSVVKQKKPQDIDEPLVLAPIAVHTSAGLPDRDQKARRRSRTMPSAARVILRRSFFFNPLGDRPPNPLLLLGKGHDLFRGHRVKINADLSELILG
jgi:hypothetical protein